MKERERIRFMLDLIACNQMLYYWCYDADGNILDSTCQMEAVLDSLIKHEQALSRLNESPIHTPIILSNDKNLMWLAVREADVGHIHLLGPFFSISSGPLLVDRLIRATRNAAGSERWKEKMQMVIRELPSISSILYTQYVLMLYYAVLQDWASSDDIHYVTCGTSIVDSPAACAPQKAVDHSRMYSYMMERALLSKVSEGDISQAEKENNISAVSGIQTFTESPLLNLKISVTTFITLCTRASIEGGLSPTIAYSMSDQYISSVFAAKSTSEIVNIKKHLYEDFIYRVHKCRTNQQYSKAIQKCIDYIETNLEEPLDLAVIADYIGYSKYYLSSKFKSEVHCSIHRYIEYARFEAAKLLLCTTTKRIEEISEEFQFKSRAFFDKKFKQIYGITPAQYRRENSGF